MFLVIDCYFIMYFQANAWCEQGKDLLASQQLDKFNTSDGASRALQSVELFLGGAQEYHLGDARALHDTYDCVMSPQTRVSCHYNHYPFFLSLFSLALILPLSKKGDNCYLAHRKL